MSNPKTPAISRRDFARHAALASAASLLSTGVLKSATLMNGVQQPSELPKLSSESQAEVDSRFQMILSLYGSRFSDEQKTDLKRLCASNQPALEHLRAYPVENEDGGALYLKPLIEREHKPAVLPKTLPADETRRR